MVGLPTETSALVAAGVCAAALGATTANKRETSPITARIVDFRNSHPLVRLSRSTRKPMRAGQAGQ